MKMAEELDLQSKLRLADVVAPKGIEISPLSETKKQEQNTAATMPERTDVSPKGKGKAVDTGSDASDFPKVEDCAFAVLPTELMNLILSFLSAVDLAAVASTCRFLYEHAKTDQLWQHLVQANVPGVRVTSSYPCASFKELYAAHDPRWFLPRYKIWFSDRDLVGRVVVIRYDPRRGCIEGYQMVAFSNQQTEEPWAANPDVTINTFSPDVKLHLDKPIVQLDAKSPDSIVMRTQRSPSIRIIRRGEDDAQASSSSASERQQQSQSSPPRPSRFQAETPMSPGSAADGMYSNFMHAKPLKSSFATHRATFPFPYGDVWPPPAVPAPHRVAGVTLQMVESGSGAPPHRPACRAEVSDYAFRIRSWIELGGSNAREGDVSLPGGGFWATAMLRMFNTPSSVAVHIGEEIATYATLEPALYTPTAEKPWRGIWVGDYSTHGCEFLLVHQPDDDQDVGAEIARMAKVEGETDEAFARRKRDETIYRGRIEAIKLTGDPHVPRGEFTFIADDLGERGYVTTLHDEPFKGARVVQSKGHIAGVGFENDRFIESQLILISNNRIAQYWIGSAHISFFERVNIDAFLAPE